jgi:rhodanese-related sulfurtransferase
VLSMEVQEAYEEWTAGRLEILDIREVPEHEASHIAGVTLIPMSEMRERLDEVPSDGRPLALICRSGARSGRLAEALSGLGDYGEVANVEGGIIAWAAAGLPYEGDEPD